MRSANVARQLELMRKIETARSEHAARTRPHAVREGRTAEALRMLASDPSLLPVDAARRAGVDPSAVYRALRRTERKYPTCPHCGKPVIVHEETPPAL